MKTKLVTALITCLLFAVSHGHAAELKVDPARSRIQVDAKATGHRFTGTLKRFEAKASGNASNLIPELFQLDWKFSDLDTDNDDRDAQMLDWLGNKQATGSFKFIKSWTDEKGRSHAMGELKINGLTKRISFPYEVKRDGDWLTVDGQVWMDHRDFKLPIIRSMAVMTVNPKLLIRFHLVGKIS
ncbi:MAG: YceI family protein [Luteolibacter sp.]